LNSDGTRFFSVNNLAIFSKIGTFTFNHGYNYEKKSVLFGNNRMNSKNLSHYVSANYKKDLVENMSFQSGITFDNQNTETNNMYPLYYYAMNEDSPTYSLDTTVSNYILEPYIYLNWDINKNISMSMGGKDKYTYK